ncbi:MULTISPECIES: monooxygenase [Phaeobacter]|uniref:Mono-oxygenase n=1 Tax=Phaeobacter inhibens TaxID=221822 RepID=A0A2I7LW58_9RHOB|nr:MULTISPECIES: monooxygenase [Phaeobacter]AFO88175.1 putative mono-oxygenase [Phaeobacter inhibens 2.10]APX15313.1 monooxygenase [Phaeobacter inhibens]AUQ49279.1 putative mono-oxygenase [Phaeobacter inhibens]AUQ54952.1 putative mono-oxygenase [Phaeobacter inhibens]AUQ65760.1 putative mono-oxygenase [Phaeobacter inhibens]
MSTMKIWDLHMTYDGPMNEEFFQDTNRLAESIAQETGVIWKIWTLDESTGDFGSTYLFRDLAALETYKAMHVQRLEAIGVTVASDHVFDIMEDLSAITHAPLGETV